MARQGQPKNAAFPQPQERAFHQAIVENPGDEATLNALEDWLEEHADPRRAGLLRLHRRLLSTCCEPEKHPERVGWQTRLVELLAEGVRPCVPQQTVGLGEGVEMTFSWIPPDTFLMGSPTNEAGGRDDELLHQVTLTKGFYLGVSPVTQAQWQTVMGSNPSHFEGADRPVETVSWDDCVAFCAQLGAKTGKGFRLPLESEWEWACRAGTTTPFHFGETISTDQANYNGSGTKGVYRAETTPVVSFPANAFGLWDMHGNVSEWCQEWSAAYDNKSIEDNQSSNINEDRVLRGGSWNYLPNGCRAANRGRNAPSYRFDIYGCRVVCLD
jgi:uncharacterized protein (TIGR02996 family)